MAATIAFRVNGRAVRLEGRGRSLLWALRGELTLTGTKYGCGVGVCGACTVLIEGRAVRSCLTTLGDVDGREVVTIEGLAAGGKLDPLQQAFIDQGALQCGYCTPGILMSAKALLLADPHPSHEAIMRAMEHQLCRCGAQQRILEAIESVAARHADTP
jgi:aerobic-type carbon monoxide dehydrogenase small subunit (CoxS/CutS family)